MTIYIDSEFKCYITEAEGRRAFEVPFFDGKCAALIEGYRYIPDGETWTREDGVEFAGEMISPCKNYDVLAAYQEQYEAMSGDAPADLLEELGAAYVEGVNSI